MLYGILVLPGTNRMEGCSIQQTSQYHWHKVGSVGPHDAHHIILFQTHSLQLLCNANGKGDSFAIG